MLTHFVRPEGQNSKNMSEGVIDHEIPAIFSHDTSL